MLQSLQKCFFLVIFLFLNFFFTNIFFSFAENIKITKDNYKEQGKTTLSSLIEKIVTSAPATTSSVANPENQNTFLQNFFKQQSYSNLGELLGNLFKSGLFGGKSGGGLNSSENKVASSVDGNSGSARSVPISDSASDKTLGKITKEKNTAGKTEKVVEKKEETKTDAKDDEKNDEAFRIEEPFGGDDGCAQNEPIFCVARKVGNDAIDAYDGFFKIKKNKSSYNLAILKRDQPDMDVTKQVPGQCVLIDPENTKTAYDEGTFLGCAKTQEDCNLKKEILAKQVSQYIKVGEKIMFYNPKWSASDEGVKFEVKDCENKE